MGARVHGLTLIIPLLLALAANAAEVRGVLAEIDADKKEVVLEGRGRGARGLTFAFSVDKATRILLGDEAGTLTDLVPGKRAHVIYETHGDRLVAVVIQAHGITPAAPPITADSNAITGTLQRVALTEREIVVVGPGPKGPETETTFAVPEDVKVMRGDQTMAFDDLKEGEAVAVTAEKRAGKMVATAIHVGGGLPPKKESRLQKVLDIAGQVMQMAEQMRSRQP